jgi:hypothetical protein
LALGNPGAGLEEGRGCVLGVAQNGLNLLGVVFGLTAPNVLTGAHRGSVAFQWPELGFLTLRC